MRRGPRSASPRPGWDPVGPDGRAARRRCATPEWKRPSLASVYALTKYVQERLTLTVAPAYGMQGVALRLFNVYGPGQALSNPYTGVLAIFASRLLNGERPLVFEDGEQRRDFVHVEDVARAFVLALERAGAPGQVFNIGSGRDVQHPRGRRRARGARWACRRSSPRSSGKARIGDIRHCFADISQARARCSASAPRRSFDGQPRRARRLGASASRPTDRVAEARRELEARGLVA